MMLTILFGVAVSAQTPTSSACLLTPEVKPDDPFQFTMAVLESLSYARTAFRPTTLPPDSDGLMEISDLIFRIKSADLDFGCAAKLLRGYQKSKDLIVSLAAFNSVVAYESVIDLDKESVVLMKRLAGNGAKAISPGDLAEQMANIRIRKDKIWDDISLVVLGVTHTLVSKVPDRDGKITSLRITTQQRTAITRNLEKYFGPDVSGPEQDDQDAILRMAVVLYHWISDQHWKTSDGR